MKYKNILVTGGAGFLATHLIPKLIKEGHDVTVITRHKPKINNLKHIQADFSDEKRMATLLKKTDVVFHLAAMVGVDRCRLNPEEVMKTNYEDTKKFINLCVKMKIKKFMFTSSSEVYGNSIDIPYKEDGKLEPVSTYGKTKVFVEKYLKDTTNESSMQVGIVRLFNVYGPYQRKSFVVPIFIDLALNNKNLTILGDGKQIRCFTYVSDATKGIIKLFKYDKSNYEIINIGCKQKYTINDVAKIVLKCIPKSQSRIEYKEYGKDGIREAFLEIIRRIPCVEKAKKLFNFEAKTTLKEGVNLMVSAL